MRLALKFKRGIVLTLAVILMLSVPLVVSGQENSASAKISTVITWTNPISVPVGPTLAGAQGVTISLTDINGNPLKNKSITWDAQSVYVQNQTTTTNERGISQNAFYVAHADRNATYTAAIEVSFAGDDTYEKSQYIMSIKCYDYGPPTPVTSTPEPPIQTPGTPSTASLVPTTPTAQPPTPIVSMPCTSVPVSPIYGYPTINKNQFLFIDTHIHKEGRGDVGPGMMIDFPTYTYSAANKILTSYIEVPNYNANTNVIIGSGTSISGTAGGGAATRLNAYNTFAYEGLYYFDSNLTVHFYMNGAWRTVAVGEKWTETIEQKTETGGVFLITYTINNYGLHEKGRFTLPISSITPTVSPIPTPTAARKFKLCGYIKPEPEINNKSYCAGFKVEIPSLGISVLTNPLGYYEFNDLPERSDKTGYTLKVTKPGYLANTVPYITFIENTEVGSNEQPVFMYSGDVNADGSINMSDIMGIAKAFNNTVNDPLFNEAADLNDDNVVNMMDVIIVAKNFNRLVSDYPKPSFMHMKYINAKVEDNIQIALNEGGIAGITWIYEVVSGSSNIKFVSKTTGAIPFPDAFVQSTWTFKALSAGVATVKFDPSYGVDVKYFINITKTETASPSKEPPAVDSSTLKSTLISTDSEQKIEAGKNIVYCPTFQMAWDELKNVVGEDIKLAGNPPLAAMLNTGFPVKDSLTPDSYVAMAGYGQETINKINDELINKFKDSAPQVNENIGSADIIAYSYLFKNISFAKAFERLSTPISFTSGSFSGNVKAFGINAISSKSGDLGKQVKIYDYKSKNDFIVKLLTENDKDEIILARVAPEDSLYKTYSAVMKRINNNVAVNYDNRDTLKVPVIDFHIGHNYGELVGRPLLNTGFTEYSVQKAYQRTRFKLDEKGAVLASEAIIVLPVSIYEPKQLVFDGPFMVILKEKDAVNPYLMVWVDNPELLSGMN